MPARLRQHARLAGLALLAGLGLPHAAAQTATSRQAESSSELVNWYYAAVFGTGIYSSGDRTVGVIQLPLAYTWQERTPDQWGIRFTAPVSFGFYNFHARDLADGLPQNVGTMSILPGVEFDTMARDNWRLRPFFGVGYGWELNESGDAWIYQAGVKSQLTFPLSRESQFMLGNSVDYAGYNANNDSPKAMARIVTGLNFAFPTHGTIMGHATDFNIHLIYYLYTTQMDLPLADNVQHTTRDQIEVAFSFSVREPIPFKLFGTELFDFDRIGFGVSTGGDVTAVRLFFSLPY